MNRNVWIVLGVVVIAIGLLNIVLGMNLVPTMSIAREKGVIAGWWLIWLMIVVTAASAGALGAFLIRAGLGKVPETASR
jgi:hypothetical protein